MSRGSWTVYTKNSIDTWVATDTIYRPNEDLEIPIVSTQQKIKAADGSDLFMTTEVKYTYDPIVFKWDYVDNDFKSQIQAYVTTAEDLKIEDHNGDTYIGRFIDFKPTWLTGQSPDMYNIESSFQIMPYL